MDDDDERDEDGGDDDVDADDEASVNGSDDEGGAGGEDGEDSEGGEREEIPKKGGEREAIPNEAMAQWLKSGSNGEGGSDGSDGEGGLDDGNLVEDDAGEDDDDDESGDAQRGGVDGGHVEDPGVNEGAGLFVGWPAAKTRSRKLFLKLGCSANAKPEDLLKAVHQKWEKKGGGGDPFDNPLMYPPPQLGTKEWARVAFYRRGPNGLFGWACFEPKPSKQYSDDGENIRSLGPRKKFVTGFGQAEIAIKYIQAWSVDTNSVFGAQKVNTARYIIKKIDPNNVLSLWCSEIGDVIDDDDDDE